MSENGAAISIRNLVKEYAAQGDAPPKLALKGVSFDVPQGGIFGLLGPNGAGKSTLINIMAGLVTKTGGAIEIWGLDIDRVMRNAKLSIGIVPQEIVFDPFFTPIEEQENQSGMYGIAKRLRRSEELLRAVHLEDKRNAYSRSLSGGMKRRLLIAKAMVHSPPVLVLDEPTAGVDVQLRRQLWELVGEPSEVTFVKAQVSEPRTREITYDRDSSSAGQVLALVQQHGYTIEDVTTREPDLEDVFVQLTSQARAASNGNRRLRIRSQANQRKN